MTQLSIEAAAVLRRAGWYPGRRVSVAVSRAFCEQHGVPFWEAAEKFLEEFGGLSFAIPYRTVLGDSGTDKVNIFSASGDPESVKPLIRGLGIATTPVGDFRRGRITLLVEQAGRLFGVSDDYYGQLGSSPTDGLSNIISHWFPTEIWPSASE